MNTTLIKLPPEGMKPVGIIHFLHGMCEHKERYEQTMSFFSAQGYICSIADMRGHGENCVEGKGLGYLGEERVDGLIEDVNNAILSLKHHYSGLPLYLCGHSMGSLVARAYCQKHDKELAGLILIGSPSYAPATPFGILLVRAISLFHKSTYQSPFITSLVTGSFQKALPADSPENAWISYRKENVEQYNADQLCGFSFTLNGYLTLFELMRSVYSANAWHVSNHELPVLFLSGADDPCRISDSAFSQAVHFMEKVGYKHVSSHLYDHMRHEILNEENRLSVWNDLLEFLHTH